MVDAEGRLVNGKRIGSFMTIHPEVDAESGRLTLRFPGEPDVSGDVALGEVMTATFFGEPRPVRPLIGPWSEALSAWAHQDLRLVAPVGDGEGIDRGPSATLLSTAALATLRPRRSRQERHRRPAIDALARADRGDEPQLLVRPGGERLAPRPDERLDRSRFAEERGCDHVAECDSPLTSGSSGKRRVRRPVAASTSGWWS